MNDKFIEKSYQKFINLPQKKDHYIEESFSLTEEQAQTLLVKLKKYCYLITHQDTKFFDIEETYYDAEDLRYERQIKLNRPKTLQIKTQKIHLNDQETNLKLIINYKTFHKTKALNIPLKENFQEWQINTLLQHKNLSFPLLKPKHSLSFTRVNLYQPHSDTKIHIDLDLYSEEKNTPEAKVTIISNQRNNFLTRALRKELS